MVFIQFNASDRFRTLYFLATDSIIGKSNKSKQKSFLVWISLKKNDLAIKTRFRLCRLYMAFSNEHSFCEYVHICF